MRSDVYVLFDTTPHTKRTRPGPRRTGRRARVQENGDLNRKRIRPRRYPAGCESYTTTNLLAPRRRGRAHGFLVLFFFLFSNETSASNAMPAVRQFCTRFVNFLDSTRRLLRKLFSPVLRARRTCRNFCGSRRRTRQLLGVI